LILDSGWQDQGAGPSSSDVIMIYPSPASPNGVPRTEPRSPMHLISKVCSAVRYSRCVARVVQPWGPKPFPLRATEGAGAQAGGDVT
jgi:hypothetical protein